MTTSKAVEAIPSGGGYQVESSLRFHYAPFFTYIPATDGVKNKWTFSCWIRPYYYAGKQTIISAYGASTYKTCLWLNDGRVEFYNVSGSDVCHFQTEALYRDPSVYMNIVIQYDSANAVEADRFAMFIDGVKVTDFEIESSVDAQYMWSRINILDEDHYIGEENNTGVRLRSYVSQMCLIENAKLGPEYFGEWHPQCPQVWRPVDLTKLDFSNPLSWLLTFDDATSATTLGYDSSGNANHWTPVNITTSDQVTDTPTNNQCTLNSINQGSGTTPSNGNLDLIGVNSTNCSVGTTIALPNTGKFYCELKVNGPGLYSMECGVVPTTENIINGSWMSYIGWGAYWTSLTNLRASYESTTEGNYTTSTIANGDTVQIAIDRDAGKMWIGLNNTWANSGAPASGTGDLWTTTIPSTTEVVFAFSNSASSTTWTMAFNEDDFTYTPPTGFKPICAKTLPEPTIKDPNDYFDILTYTGAGSYTVMSTSNKADHVVIKCLAFAYSWSINDSVRGKDKQLAWDASVSETTFTNHVRAFGGTTGFNIGSGNEVNASAYDYVAYCWTKSATAGMDILLYTGTGVNRTIAHSLGVVPELMIIKNRDFANRWPVYFAPLGNATKMYLDGNNAAVSTGNWNNTSPTATHFTVAPGEANSDGHNMIAYLFASVEGFSKVFTYTGNGNEDGSFIYCGFKPAFVIIKRTDSTGSWCTHDGVRSTENPIEENLYADTAAAETIQADRLDFLSNGFKLRSTANWSNASGGVYVGIAFAEYPFALQGGQ